MPAPAEYSDQRQSRARVQADGVARVQVGAGFVTTLISCMMPPSAPAAHVQGSAVFGQHGVQRDHRLPVGPGQRAEVGLIGEAGDVERRG